jgi:polar amino acid transport system ATP-binding protein
VITDPSVEPTAIRRRLGMVFQSFNLFPHMSVLDNVALGPVRAQGVPREQARERSRELLARFGLDEVTSALDPELVGEVLAVIRDLKVEGMTMLIATHEMAFARDVADEVCFLHDGRVLERGSADQVLSAPQQPETQRFLRRLLEAR